MARLRVRWIEVAIYEVEIETYQTLDELQGAGETESGAWFDAVQRAAPDWDVHNLVAVTERTLETIDRIDPPPDRLLQLIRRVPAREEKLA